jgi:hypothetical protein
MTMKYDHTAIGHALKKFERRRDKPPYVAWLADPRIVALLEAGK